VSLVSALEERLRGVPDLVEATAGRIGTSKRLSGVPAIVIRVVADPRPQHFKGFILARPSEVQVDVWAGSDALAGTIAKSVIAALCPAADVAGVRFQRAMITNVRGGPEQERSAPTPRLQAELFRHSIDFTFTHNAT
jgi:hypothetical protein